MSPKSAAEIVFRRVGRNDSDDSFLSKEQIHWADALFENEQCTDGMSPVSQKKKAVIVKCISVPKLKISTDDEDWFSEHSEASDLDSVSSGTGKRIVRRSRLQWSPCALNVSRRENEPKSNSSVTQAPCYSNLTRAARIKHGAFHVSVRPQLNTSNSPQSQATPKTIEKLTGTSIRSLQVTPYPITGRNEKRHIDVSARTTKNPSHHAVTVSSTKSTSKENRTSATSQGGKCSTQMSPEKKVHPQKESRRSSRKFRSLYPEESQSSRRKLDSNISSTNSEASLSTARCRESARKVLGKTSLDIASVHNVKRNAKNLSMNQNTLGLVSDHCERNRQSEYSSETNIRGFKTRKTTQPCISGPPSTLSRKRELHFSMKHMREKRTSSMPNQSNITC